AASQIVDTAASLGRVVTKQAAEELEVLLDRQGRVQILAQALRHVRDTRTVAISVALVGHVAAQHVHTACLYTACARNQRQQARLPHAVGADQACDSARRYVQVHARQGDRLAVFESNVAQA